MQLIRAQTDDEREVALTQLSGSGSHRVNHIRNEIVSLCADIEAAIDFSDQDIEITTLSNIIHKLTDIEASINRVLLESETGKVDSKGLKPSCMASQMPENQALLTPCWETKVARE